MRRSTAAGVIVRHQVLIAAEAGEELIEGDAPLPREVAQQLGEELIQHPARQGAAAPQQARQLERHPDRQPPGPQRVDGREGEDAQELLAQHVVEEVGHRGAVVRRGHGDHAAEGPRAPLHVHLGRQRDLRARQEPRVEAAARVADHAHLAAGLVEQAGHLLGQERGALAERGGGRRAHLADLPVQAEVRADLGEQVAHVAEVGEVAEVREAEEPRHEQDVVAPAHARSLRQAAGTGRLDERAPSGPRARPAHLAGHRREGRVRFRWRGGRE